MLKSLGAGLLFLLVSAGTAVADNMCGDAPIPPTIPSVPDMKTKAPADAESAKHSAFEDIKRWQGELKYYRDCLNATVATDRRKIFETQRGDKPDKDKIARLNLEIDASNHAYDASVDDEERTVNMFNAASVAYCARTGVDHSSCPKR